VNEPVRDKRRVLVTGATGFLGHHLVQQLVETGHEVVALCRDPESEAARRLPAAVERARGDVLDATAVEAAARGCTVLMHCAGKVSRDPKDALELDAVHVQGTRIALDAARRAQVRRCVYASTSGVVSVTHDPDHIGREDDEPPVELCARLPYYRSKLYAEQEALARNTAELEVVVVNPSLLLGPGDLHGSSTEDVRRALEHRALVVPAGGVAFVDARDAAHGMLLAMQDGKPGRRYLLNACNCSTRTFFDRIARVGEVPGPVAALPDHDAVRKLSRWLVRRATALIGEDDGLPDEHSVDLSQHYWYVDASRAESELGWRARDPMVTLADTIADLRARGLVMMRAPQ
jgi:dihydroflavonol-4-reductase